MPKTSKVFLIAEVGIWTNHNGDLKLAKQLILAAKACGWDAVKFQKRTINIVYDSKFLDGPRKSPWGTTQREQKQGLEFDIDDYTQIDAFCRVNSIPWFASAWDLPSLEFLERFQVPFHKVASAHVTNPDFLTAVARLRKKTFLSTGGCEMADILQAVKIFEDYKCPLVIMHCVMGYPVPAEKCNVRFVRRLKQLFPKHDIGYSGHETGIAPTVAAMALGATVIERHITTDRAMYGSDQAASLEPPGMLKIAQYAKEISSCMGTGKKGFSADEKAVADKLRYWE